MTGHRVVLVVESPFSERDQARFGVADLVAAGLTVEVWDVTDLTLPGARRQWQVQSRGLPVHRLTDWSAVADLASTLTSDDAVVLICGVIGTLTPRYEPLLTSVLGAPAIVGAIAVGSIPPVRGADRARQELLRAAVRVVSVSKPKVRLPRGLDFVWAGTTYAGIARGLRTSTTSCRYVHALDFDLILGLSHPCERNETSVFLDTMGPLHPDYVSLAMRNPWRPGAYETLVADLFAACDRVGQAVVVAAHPRAAPGSLDLLYPGRSIVHGYTPRLMSECRFVMTIEGSTSLGLAAVLGTPVLFVGDDRVPPFVAGIAERFRGALGATRCSVEGLLREPLPPRVDERSYSGYVRRFVKRPGTPRMRFWTSVAEDLKCAWSDSAR